MLFVVLLMPTLLLFLGLFIFQSVPLSFVLFYGWLGILPCLVFWRRGQTVREALADLGLTVNWPAAGVGLLSGVIFLLTIFLSVSWLATIVLDVAGLQGQLARWGFSGNWLWVMILVLTLLNPLLEEVYWRGTSPGLLPGHWGPGMKNSTSAFFYSLYHLLTIAVIFRFPLNILGVVPVFAAGIIWGLLKERYKSLWGPIISHALADIGIILVYLKYIH